MRNREDTDNKSLKIAAVPLKLENPTWCLVFKRAEGNSNSRNYSLVYLISALRKVSKLLCYGDASSMGIYM